MNMKNSILILFVLSFILSCSNEIKIELPITEINGYGPFESGRRGIFPYSEDLNDPLRKTYLKVTGIPANLSDLKVGGITINGNQSAYQDYLLGNISKEQFESFQKKIGFDTLSLSKEPIKCKVAFAFGKDSTGQTRMVVDANNNLDLSDDNIFTPFEFNPKIEIKNDSVAINNSVKVVYERYANNKIIEVNTPLFIIHKSESNGFMCNFPQYASAKLDGEEIAICSDRFAYLNYNFADITLMNDSLRNGAKAKNENIISKNDYIKVKGKIYKNIGVNLNKNVLTLEKVDLPQNQLYSSQVGFKALPFEGNDFTTNSSISLDNLNGKYVLLDFWAVWCGPCKEEMPNLKSFYEKIDKSKFEIIGIVGDSPSAELKKIIDEQTINWPQILSDDTNKLKEKYGISGYPTTFLIDPEGIIVAKNLRGKELEHKIISLTKLQ